MQRLAPVGGLERQIQRLPQLKAYGAFIMGPPPSPLDCLHRAFSNPRHHPSTDFTPGYSYSARLKERHLPFKELGAGGKLICLRSRPDSTGTARTGRACPWGARAGPGTLVLTLTSNSTQGAGRFAASALGFSALRFQRSGRCSASTVNTTSDSSIWTAAPGMIAFFSSRRVLPSCRLGLFRYQ